jgi:hypothetical protein
MCYYYEMIKPKITIHNTQAVQAAVKKALDDIMTDKFVTVGIHEDAGNHESDDITNAALGAVHEFGADINHPGGTSYGFASKAAAERNDVRFLKTGKGYAELGTTKAHEIKIPARPWLNPGVNSGNLEYIAIIEKAAAKGEPLDMTLNKIGVTAVGLVQKYMTELRTPPNAASTIKKKGSSNPLIDSGALRQSVTYKITSTKPTEGL